MCGVDIEKRYTNGVISDNNVNANGVLSTNHNHSLSNHHDNHDHHYAIVNVDRGDPKIFYPYWKKVDNKCEITIKASEFMSYFADNTPTGIFYQLPEFTNAVRNLHRTVGNAVTDDRYIVSGTGSSQLFTVALRALANKMDCGKKPIPVVSAVPYYSCYEEALKEENSKIYQWYGDAAYFNKDGPYVEVVTTPNNPDGTNRQPVVNRKGGVVICDLAYYWPQYTPITQTMDYDIMLFTLSKLSGHAGSRVGWAIVKDKEVASNMVKQMTLMTIGTCQEGQLRATKIMEYIANNHKLISNEKQLLMKQPERFFEFGHRVLADRWEKLREVVDRCGAFRLLHFPSEFCIFRGKIASPTPAYAWMESKTNEDASRLMNELKIKTRGGERFGVSSRYTRISMLESDDTFNLLLQRLTLINL